MTTGLILKYLLALVGVIGIWSIDPGRAIRDPQAVTIVGPINVYLTNPVRTRDADEAVRRNQMQFTGYITRDYMTSEYKRGRGW